MGLESERFCVLLSTLVAYALSMNVADFGLYSNKVEILMFERSTHHLKTLQYN
jgi:hypothetical protein